jgi:hypothetical protein
LTKNGAQRGAQADDSAVNRHARNSPSSVDPGFAAALALIAKLPLTKAEKAEAVRRLLSDG